MEFQFRFVHPVSGRTGFTNKVELAAGYQKAGWTVYIYSVPIGFNGYGKVFKHDKTTS